MVSIKEYLQEFQKSFVPNGEKVDIRPLIFRPTGDDEACRCCWATAHDKQSGLIYCGAVAEFVADVMDDTGKVIGRVALCGKQGHIPPANPLRASELYVRYETII